MKKQGNNFAYIDGQNLNLGIKGLRWTFDYFRFRRYLAEKYFGRDKWGYEFENNGLEGLGTV